MPILQEQTPAPEKAQERKKKETIHKRSIFLFWFTLAALLVIFGGRWLVAITNDYFDSFVHRGSSVTEAVNNMEGLTLTEGEQAELLPLQQQWDLFTSSRLRDEVTMTASDGTELHAYLYNEQSDTTVVVIPPALTRTAPPISCPAHGSMGRPAATFCCWISGCTAKAAAAALASAIWSSRIWPTG